MRIAYARYKLCSCRFASNMNLLKRGRSLFFIGAMLFFPGVVYLGLFVTYGNASSIFTEVGFAMSGIFILVGLPMLLLAGAVLFKNRRIA